MAWRAPLDLLRRHYPRRSPDLTKTTTDTPGDTAHCDSSDGSMDPRDADPLAGAVEILPGRLHYAPLRHSPPAPPSSSPSSHSSQHSPAVHYFCVDEELAYWNFFRDFGPLNLGQLHQFCQVLNAALNEHEVVCYYSGPKPEQRANAAFLVSAWSVLYLGRTAEAAFAGFQDPSRREGSGESANASRPPRREGAGPCAPLRPLPPFHDASPGNDAFGLTVLDCLQGLEAALHRGFFRFADAPPRQERQDPATAHLGPPLAPSPFDPVAYETFEQVERGDLNWIVQDKLLAFAGPQHSRVVTPEGCCTLTPGDYIPHFNTWGVTLVVRLNARCYDEGEFERAGVAHAAHCYPDGSCPPLSILRAVVRDLEEGLARNDDTGAAAVHCKAGLGRTGTCIGAYLMKHHRLTAREAIGWLRVCRPGSVIGPQQGFLERVQEAMWQEGEEFYAKGPTGMRVDEEAGEAGGAGAAVAMPGAAATPEAMAGTPLRPPQAGGVALVTPDGRPLRLPATPVAARKRELTWGAADAPSAPATRAATAPAAVSGADAPPFAEFAGAPTPPPAPPGREQGHEVEQADALLARRLNRYQARQGQREE